MMRILFFTDIHGSTRHLNEIVEKSRNADIIACPGDLTIFENGLDEIFRKLNSTGKPIIVIHGNHESASSMSVLSLRYKNVHFIHKSYYIHEDVIFFGHGGGGFDSFQGLPKPKKEDKNFRLILLTHAPPYGTAIDDMDGGWHVGCKNYKEFILAHQPILAVSGHIHETFELEEQLGNTLMFNPGPRGRIIKL